LGRRTRGASQAAAVVEIDLGERIDGVARTGIEAACGARDRDDWKLRLAIRAQQAVGLLEGVGELRVAETRQDGE
jgi:hypothetical protein